MVIGQGVEVFGGRPMKRVRMVPQITSGPRNHEQCIACSGPFGAQSHTPVRQVHKLFGHRSVVAALIAPVVTNPIWDAPYLGRKVEV